MNAYNTEFYDLQIPRSTRSAERVVPLVESAYKFSSVVDLGCGSGAWLSVFHKRGVDDILGLDGDHVPRAALRIPQERFRPTDLSRPFVVDRTFDLAVSLEVAEHLPESAADRFVDSLTTLAPVVLFSAAIPFQGGTHHVNEQWPSYWAAKFARRGFVPVDFLRDNIWDDESVEWWYTQNVLMYVRESTIHDYPDLERLRARIPSPALDRVHPRLYLRTQTALQSQGSAARILEAARFRARNFKRFLSGRLRKTN